MRLHIRLCLLATTFVVLAALVPGVTAIAIGGPAGGFILPGGSTASFTNLQFAACNSLSWGYQLAGGANQVQATFPGGCTSRSASNVTIGPFTTPMTLRAFLTDNHCNNTYYSDGSPVDHVIVAGSNPYSLRFADSGAFCERTGIANDFAGFNFRVDLAISGQVSFAPGGGSFVIGDQNAVIGSSVTFWDAQWAKDNSLTGGAAPASFKGFAESPTTPACGARWSTDPGNSTPPPGGSLPAFMGVIVTGSAGKTGSTISGNTVHIVIVQTDPGYSPNPGHAGTGKVVTVVC